MDTSINNQNIYIKEYGKCAVDYYDVTMPTFRNQIGNMKKSATFRESQIQRINNQEKIIQKSESYQSKNILMKLIIGFIGTHFNYQKYQTPDILKGARERIKCF